MICISYDLSLVMFSAVMTRRLEAGSESRSRANGQERSMLPVHHMREEIVVELFQIFQVELSSVMDRITGGVIARLKE